MQEWAWFVGRPGDIVATQVEAQRLKVVYILGSQRGGTTIVSRALGATQGFVFAGELRRLWGALLKGAACGCGLTHERCPVWSSVLARPPCTSSTAEQMLRLQEDAVPSAHSWLRTYRLLRSGIRKPEERSYLTAVSELYRAYAEVSEASVVIDGSKDSSDVALLLASAELEVFPVHVVRDPHGSAYSRMSRSHRGGHGSHPWSLAYGALSWSSRHLAADVARRPYGEKASLLRYEDFVADPESSLASIVRQVIGTDGHIPVDGSTAELPTAHTPAGRGRHVAGPVQIRLDDRWRTEMSGFDRSVVSAITSPVARRYGYPLD